MMVGYPVRRKGSNILAIQRIGNIDWRGFETPIPSSIANGRSSFRFVSQGEIDIEWKNGS